MIRPRQTLLAALALTTLVASPALAKSPVHLELGPFLGGYFFSEDQDIGEYNGENPPADYPGTSFDVGGRLGVYFFERIGVEGELGYLPASLVDSGNASDVMNYRIQGVFALPLGKLVPFLVVGYGELHLTSDAAPDGIGDDDDPAFQWGLGAKYFLNDWFGLRLDLRHLLTDNLDGKFGASNFEITVSPFFAALRGEDAPPPPPPPDPDPDKDGVLDAADLCPSVAGPASNNGCPEVDTDRDGLLDKDDRCANTPGPVENGGCPDTDRDGDGIVDRLDRCPDQRGDQANQGCLPPDADNDGFPDAVDKCPQQAETKNNYQDDDGCPDEIPQAVAKFTGALKGIKFALNKADILPASKPTLDEAVKVLQQFPDVKLEISGHTDATGPRDANMTLSQARADSVRNYIIGKGIADTRLRAVGYGPDKPIADNTTPAGQAENRRIEFQLIQQ